MLSIDGIIGELLLRHNCVILPGFGGFIAQRQPARIDYHSGTMHPPGKSILFNRQLINNDGLLVAEFGLRNGLGYEMAFNEVSIQIEHWNDRLRSGRRIELDKVGILYLDAERNLCFEQDRFFNLLLESFGLTKVHFVEERDLKRAQMTLVKVSSDEVQKPLVEVVDEKEPIIIALESEQFQEVPAENEVVMEPASEPRKRPVWRYLAAASLLVPIAFYSFWLPMKTNVLQSGVISIQDFNPFHQKQEVKQLDQWRKIPAYCIARIPSPQPYNSVTEESIVMVNETQIESTEPVSEGSPEPTLMKESFELIVGSFSDPQNVQEHVTLLQEKGINTKVLNPHNGLIRISAGSYKSMDLARAKQEILTSSGVDAWIMKSK